MSLVNIMNVEVLDNPASFSDSFRFEITFECLSSLEEDLNWKLVYVGSAETEKYDQILDSIMVGPVPVGVNKFVFEADPPDPKLIPQDEIRGVTVLLLVCSYLEQEFIRIGYYIDNDYEDPLLIETPPEKVDQALLKRNILANKPRVTRFNIIWDAEKWRLSREGAIDVPEELLNAKDEEEEGADEGFYDDEAGGFDKDGQDSDTTTNEDYSQDEDQEEEEEEVVDGKDLIHLSEDDEPVEKDNEMNVDDIPSCISKAYAENESNMAIDL